MRLIEGNKGNFAAIFILAFLTAIGTLIAILMKPVTKQRHFASHIPPGTIKELMYMSHCEEKLE